MQQQWSFHVVTVIGPVYFFVHLISDFETISKFEKWVILNLVNIDDNVFKWKTSHISGNTLIHDSIERLPAGSVSITGRPASKQSRKFKKIKKQSILESRLGVVAAANNWKLFTVFVCYFTTKFTFETFLCESSNMGSFTKIDGQLHIFSSMLTRKAPDVTVRNELASHNC